MKIAAIPVVIIGAALIIVGLWAAFAPELLVVSGASGNVFEIVPRLPIGLAVSAIGALMVKEGWKGARHYIGLFSGVIVSVFFAVGSTTPAFLGDRFLPFGPIVFRGYINGLTVTMWLATAVLCGYYYIHLRQRTNF